MPTEWFIARDKNQLGPFSSSQLRRLAKTGKLSPNDLVWKEGLRFWVEASRVESLFSIPMPQSDSQTLDQPGKGPTDNDIAFEKLLQSVLTGHDSSNTSLPSLTDEIQKSASKTDDIEFRDADSAEPKSDDGFSAIHSTLLTPRPATETAEIQENKSCPYCAERILQTATKCKHCGEHLFYSSSGCIETIFLQSDGVLVTNTRYVQGSVTFSIAAISSVRLSTETKDISGKMGCLTGLLVLFFIVIVAPIGNEMSDFLVAKGLSIGLFIATLYALKHEGDSNKPIHYLYLTMSSGEVKAVSNCRRDFVEVIHSALTRAIVIRGLTSAQNKTDH